MEILLRKILTKRLFKRLGKALLVELLDDCAQDKETKVTRKQAAAIKLALL